MLAQQRMVDTNGNPGLDLGAAWDAAMRAGDFGAAWAVSDAVLAGRDWATRDDPGRPYHERWVWDGRGFDRRHVVVRCFHGLGDTLQFCRFLPALRSRAAHVTLEAQPELAPLLRALPGIDRLHPFDPARPLPGAECDFEIMELCHALRLEPDPAPYLRAAPLPSWHGGVGLCWAAGGWDPARSIDAVTVRPLAALARPVSLQRGLAAVDARLLGAVDPLGGSLDVMDTARLIAGLDVVVTVDTMVAHLAGALGRPAVVLLKHEPDWRWGGEGAGCAWYGSVRTARQPAPGDWAGAVAAALPMVEGTLAAAGGL